MVAVLATIFFRGIKNISERRREGEVKKKGVQMRSCFDVKQGSFNNKTRVMLHTAEAPSILAP